MGFFFGMEGWVVVLLLRARRYGKGDSSVRNGKGMKCVSTAVKRGLVGRK